MKDQNYGEAIRHYEHGLSLSPLSQLNQYVRFRLALAYSLTEQFNHANRLVESLQTETPVSPLIKDALTALHTSLASTPTPLAICTVVYDVFKRYQDLCHATHNACSAGDPYGSVIGITLDNIEAYADRWYWIPQPESAGCDPSSLQKSVSQTPTPIPSPIQWASYRSACEA